MVALADSNTHSRRGLIRVRDGVMEQEDLRPGT